MIHCPVDGKNWRIAAIERTRRGTPELRDVGYLQIVFRNDDMLAGEREN